MVTNAAFLGAVLAHDDVVAGRHTTRWLGDHVVELLAASAPPAPPAPEPEQRARAGVKVDARDPLAVLAHGKGAAADGGGAGPAPAVAVAVAPSDVTGPEGSTPVRAPIQGTIVSVTVAEGQEVLAGQGLLVMEAMKMEHVVAAPASGVVAMVTVEPGDTIFEGHPLVFVTEGEVSLLAEDSDEEVDLDHIRPDLAEVIARHRFGDDESRPEAVARRTEKQYRTVRENVEDLIDPGSLREYGALVVAAQRRRRSVDDLMANTPADGLVAGVASVNGDLFDERAAQCVVVAYDYTVLAGTQGTHNHLKKDKMFELAGEWRLPVVVYTEGGGGRPGDTDGRGAGLDCWAFHYYGRLSGLVPLVGVNNGYCFAGNAALLGTCDVVIATATSNIGMGGPAMIEGGNLGVFHPTEVGPMSVQQANGVVDIAVADEKEATAVAKRYLSYFQGDLAEWDCADQRLLRSLIPENRLRIYDVRRVIETIADTGTVLELRRDFGLGMVTSLLRIEGSPVGVVANNPTHLAGAIDSDGADKAARFMQLCDNFDIPLLFLCDTPGMMVGPEVEKTALVRHCCRLFAIGANLSVPACTIVLRKGYGLGAQAMAAGSFKAPYFTVAWPTGEFGGMGLEGAVKLGYRKELEAETDPDARVELYQKMVDRMYEAGKAVNTAMTFEIDDVIDPAESRHWITSLLVSRPSGSWRDRPRKRPHLDTW